MARKASGGVSKSELIRKAHSENPTAGPTELAKSLEAAHGMAFSAAMVSTVLSQDRSRGGKPAKRGRPKKSGAGKASAKTSTKTSTKTSSKAAPKAASKKGSGDLSIETLLQVKKMTEQLGGVEKARAALDALTRILG
jgi:hypothetical protein